LPVVVAASEPVEETRPSADEVRRQRREASKAQSKPKPKAKGGAIARAQRGRIESPTSIRGVVAMNLTEPASNSQDLVSLAALLLSLPEDRGTKGTLTVTCGRKEAKLLITGGRLYYTTADETAAFDAFGEASGAYYFEPGQPDVGARSWTSPRRFVAEAIRRLAGRRDPLEIVDSLGANSERAPLIDEDRGGVVHTLGLREADQRTLRLAFDGKTSARRLALGPADSAKASTRLLVVLAAFSCLRWRKAARSRGSMSTRRLERKARDMEAQNFFDVLEVHWSAPAHEVKGAYEKLQKQLENGAERHAAAPAAGEQIRKRAKVAFEALKDADDRAAYTKETYADLDFQGIVDVVRGSIDSHLFRGEEQKANETRSKLKGLHNTFRRGKASKD